MTTDHSMPSPGRRSRRRSVRWRRVVLLTAALALAALVLDMLPAGLLPDAPPRRREGDARILIGVLGDSDSQGYQDRKWHPAVSGMRGGSFHHLHFSWAEIIAKLRASEADLGERGTYGGRKAVVRVLETLGLERRAPRKEDHRYNLAFGGARCADLHEGVFRQVPRLLAEMRREPIRWRRGVVVIRIGIVDIGGLCGRMADSPEDADLLRTIDGCVAHVARAVQEIRAEHPETAIVLVGIQNAADFPPLLERWQDPAALTNIRRCLDRYDSGLRQLCERHARMRFFDDRQFFAARFGGRDGMGRPAYNDLRIGSKLTVTHGIGDAPHHSLMGDEHYSGAYNAVWAQAMSRLLAELVGVTPIADLEVERFLTGLDAPG